MSKKQVHRPHSWIKEGQRLIHIFMPLTIIAGTISFSYGIAVADMPPIEYIS